MIKYVFLLAVYPKSHSITMVTAWPYIYIYVTEQEAISNTFRNCSVCLVFTASNRFTTLAWSVGSWYMCDSSWCSTLIKQHCHHQIFKYMNGLASMSYPSATCSLEVFTFLFSFLLLFFLNLTRVSTSALSTVVRWLPAKTHDSVLSYYSSTSVIWSLSRYALVLLSLTIR